MAITSDTLIKPISKRATLLGNVLVLVFIASIVLTLFFIPAKANFTTKIMLAKTENGTNVGYCIIPSSQFKHLDLNSLKFQISDTQKNNLYHKLVITDIKLDSANSKYILTLSIDNFIKYDLPIAEASVVFNRLNDTWGDLIFKMR